MRKQVASGMLAGTATVASTVVSMMWQSIDPVVGKWILIACGAVFVAAAVLFLWPFGRGADSVPTTEVTTHGPHSPGFGSVGGNVNIFHNPPPPAPRQEPRSGHGGGIGSLRPGLATYGLEPPKPDMKLDEVVERVEHHVGPPPSPGPERKEFWRKVNLELADKVSINDAHVWGRHGNRALSNITSYWSQGTFDHRKGTLTVLLNSYVGTPFDYVDLHFNCAEIDKIWPKPREAQAATVEKVKSDHSTQPEQFPPPYRKAVLQLQKPVVTKTASGGRVSEITSVECTLMIEGKAAIKEGRIWLGELRLDGGSLALNTYVRIGRSGDNTFPINRAGLTARVILVRRDMTDIVSKPPFLLFTDRGDFPLNENTQYHLDLELRSEAEHPTKVTLLIATGSGHELDAEIESQSV